MAFIPHGISVVLSGTHHDMAQPRNTIDNLSKDTTVDKRLIKRIVRAKSASANGFESLGYFAAAVVAANAARVPMREVNTLALAYVGARAAYNFVYIVLQENNRLYPLRTAAWLTCTGLISWLFVRAGQVVNA
jgi:uncharacterized MAPEG superfamily protein